MFRIASGSVIGKSHIRLGRNNQDAYAHAKIADEVFAVVCDGCGSGMNSEVGAQIGCRIILDELQNNYLMMGWCEDPSQNLELALKDIQNRIVDKILRIAYKMDVNLPSVIKDYFLFTIIVAVIGYEKSFVASIGDGFYAINDEVTSIGPFENNAPPYIAYNAIPNAVNHSIIKEKMSFKIHSVIDTKDVKNILIATDGVEDILRNELNVVPGKKSNFVGSLDQFWTNDLFFNNKAALDRRLVQLARDSSKINGGLLVHERGYLMDDTTIISIRRKQDECLSEREENTD